MEIYKSNQRGNHHECEAGPTGKKIEDTVEKAELVVYKNGNEFNLAYKTNLQFIQPYPANWVVYVDAVNGNILNSYNAVADGTGSAF